MGSNRLLNVTLFGHHGVSRAEREAGTRLCFDLELEQDLEAAARSDALAETIDYMEVHRELEAVVQAGGHRLLESLAAAAADRLLARFGVRRVLVRVRKDNLPLGGGVVEIELERHER